LVENPYIVNIPLDEQIINKSSTQENNYSPLTCILDEKSNQGESVNISQDNQAYQASPCRRSLPFTKQNKSFINQTAKSSTQCIDKLDLYKQLNEEWAVEFKNFIISENQLIIDRRPGRTISKGLFGRILRGKGKNLPHTKHGIISSIAVKIMDSTTDSDLITSYISEALIIKNFKHKNIMDLLGVVLKPSQPPLLVEPYMKYSDLNSYLRRCRTTPRQYQKLSSRQLANFAQQIACGMEYISAQGFLHRSLQTRNCMVNEKLEIKIAGFELSRGLNHDEQQYKMNIKTSLPIKWMAIESFTDFIFSQKTDVWSFGILIWEIFSFGQQPYSGLSNQDMEKYLTKGYRLKRPPNCADALFELMSGCWQANSFDRPTFSTLHQQLLDYDSTFQKYSLDFISNSPTQVL